jgi:hypothetical protein
MQIGLGGPAAGVSVARAGKNVSILAAPQRALRARSERCRARAPARSRRGTALERPPVPRGGRRDLVRVVVVVGVVTEVGLRGDTRGASERALVS